MPNAMKEMMREELARGLEGQGSFLLVGFTGIDSDGTAALRKGLRDKKLRLRVIHNRIARRALDQLGISGLESQLKGQTAVLSGTEDPVALAKSVGELGPAAEKLVVKGGLVQGKVVSREDVLRLAKLPGRLVLLARLVGSIQSPVVRIVRCVKGPVSRLNLLVKALAEKKKQEQPAGA